MADSFVNDRQIANLRTLLLESDCRGENEQRRILDPQTTTAKSLSDSSIFKDDVKQRHSENTRPAVY